MQDKPKISIISPSKNTGRFAKETIESILAQTYTNWEHIVVDGGSTDETLDVIRQYPHIRWISEEDSGADEAFRKGLAMAKGEYVMLCCISDGYLDRNWFKKCVEILAHQLEISLVWGIDQKMLEDGTLHRIADNSFFKNPPPSGRDFIYYWLENKTFFKERNLCVRKNVIEACFPPFDPKTLGQESAFLTFFYNFNVFGYLPYFIPNLAAYARIHHDAANQREEKSGVLGRSLRKYYSEAEQYKRKIIKGEIKHHYRDGFGNVLPDGLNQRKYLNQARVQKFKKIIIYLMPPLASSIIAKLLARCRVKQNMKKLLKRTPIYPLLLRVRLKREKKRIIGNWKKMGKPIPPPHLIKEETVKEYAYKFSTDILVETGTYQGDMIVAMKNVFSQIYSIELGSNLYRKAKEQFASASNIHILQGDSSKVLLHLLTSLRQPCLFWLDAHYSRGITVRGDLNSPIWEELKHIFAHRIKDHVILIDDARCFTGQEDYPTTEDLRDLVAKERPNWVFEVRDDIIRIHKYVPDYVHKSGF